MSDFHVINLEAYQTPEIYEDPKEVFVGYGEDNNFYQELIDSYLNSPTLNSIVMGVSGQIFGRGFSALDASRRPDEFAAFKGLFKDKDLKRICLDYKLLGEASFQVSYLGKKVVKVSHFNRETLRAEKCDDKGVINAYYYHPKWVDYQEGDKLTRIPVFGSGAVNEIYIIRKYIPSMHYYSPPDWCSSLNYSKLEGLISQYLINEVNCNFSSGKLISMSNGIPTIQKQEMIKAEIMNKLTGVNGEKIIVSFSDSAENKTTIEDINAADSVDIYQYVSEECSKKLLLANRITSPLLVGIRDGSNGLGSNSEEIENAHNLFENVVIKPYQSDIIDAIDDILAVNGIALKIYVQTLTPIEFTDEKLVTQEQKEEETGQKLSSDKPEMTEEHEQAILNSLDSYGEELGEEWELVEEQEAESIEGERQAQKNLNLLEKQAVELFSFTPDTTAKSKYDQGLYILRYKYDGNPQPERKFCKEMMNRNTGKYGMLYRFEDVEKLSALDPNPGLGLGGSSNYDLFLYSGGNNCKHRWKRMVFFRKREDGKFLPKSKTKAFENDKKVANTPFKQPPNSGKAQKTPASRGINNK